MGQLRREYCVWIPTVSHEEHLPLSWALLE